MTVHNDNKVCEHNCPMCGANGDDIDWGSFQGTCPPYQNASCSRCGCEFCEVYSYAVTTFNKETITPIERLLQVAKNIVSNSDIYRTCLAQGDISKFTSKTVLEEEEIEILRRAIKRCEEENK